jgi:DNA polymerase III sliding clamp (beta) subunit (PCNA family)
MKGTNMSIKLNASDLKSRFKKLTPFMSKEATRYYLQGVYLEYADNRLKATATNGHILCTMEWDVEGEHEPFAVICPAGAVSHICKIGTVHDVLIQTDGKYIEFDFFDFHYKTPVVDGTYPDYNNIIPEGKSRLQKGMNAKYVIAALKALDNKPVNIEVDSNLESVPHLFSSDEVEGIRCVVMPQRV